MRQSAWILVLGAAVALSACGGKKPVAVATPPPVAPATPPPAPPPTVEPRQVSEYDRIKVSSVEEINRMGLLAEIHFDYDRSDVRESDRAILAKNAENLKKFDFLKVTVEGHCDERGSVEYNIALGEKRAKAAYDYLVQLGVPAARLKTVSYGKEVPVCQDANESCWARNRRAAFVVNGKTN